MNSRVGWKTWSAFALILGCGVFVFALLPKWVSERPLETLSSVTPDAPAPAVEVPEEPSTDAEAPVVVERPVEDPEPPPAHLAPSCAEAGVLGVLPGIIGVVQATEAIKLILGQGDPLIGRLLTYDSLKMTFRTLKLRKDKTCPVCGEHPTIKEYIDYEGFCAR